MSDPFKTFEQQIRLEKSEIKELKEEIQRLKSTPIYLPALGMTYKEAFDTADEKVRLQGIEIEKLKSQLEHKDREADLYFWPIQEYDQGHVSTDPIKELIYAERFYPFQIFHKKGKTYDVPSRDFCWVSPIGVYVVIEDHTNGRRHQEILNPDLIEKVKTHEEAETNP